jgi:hypothetical protein
MFTMFKIYDGDDDWVWTEEYERGASTIDPIVRTGCFQHGIPKFDEEYYELAEQIN